MIMSVMGIRKMWMRVFELLVSMSEEALFETQAVRLVKCDFLSGGKQVLPNKRFRFSFNMCPLS